MQKSAAKISRNMSTKAGGLTYQPVTFVAGELQELLPGTRHQGEGTLLARTKYLRDFFAEKSTDGHPKQFWFETIP